MRKDLMKILAILMCFTMMVVANVSAATTITTNQTGVQDGYLYSFWSDGVGSVIMTLGPGGNYSVDWSNCGHFYCGKGWSTGGARVITYTGTFTVNGDAVLSVNGWTTNPLIEYNVVENYGSWTPPGSGTSVGTLTTDGGTYNLYRTQAVNQPSIIGTATFYRYWSVRTSKRSSGFVTIGNHFNAWANNGWRLGTHNYQIMEVEGYRSSGNANITVGGGPTPLPTIGPTMTPAPTAWAQPTPTPIPRTKPYIVNYVIQSDWGTGATINVTIKNNTDSPVNGWTLAFTFPGNQIITNLWNGTYTQSGASVSVKGSTSIPANGGSTNFGFNLKYSGTNAKPASFTLNGAVCTIQ